MIQRATMGRPNPRAPYVALDVMVQGAALPLRAANKLERDAFVDVATSSEGKAGMRFFFTQQSVQKLPKDFPGKPRQLKKIGVDGIDGYMGNAIAWLALEAGYQVVGHVPLAQSGAWRSSLVAIRRGPHPLCRLWLRIATQVHTPSVPGRQLGFARSTSSLG